MTLVRTIALFGALALGACDAKIGRGDAETGNAVAASAEGKAEDGKISVKAPGLDLSFSVPKGIADKVQVDTDSELLYPGATMRGVHVSQGSRGDSGEGESEAEIRFTSPDAPEKVAAWYRDAARAGDFTLAPADREGNGATISGTTRDRGDFRLHLAPASGGGTAGRLIVRDKG